jgi:hypothetical protein
MKIKIASKNEYLFYPDIETDLGNNKKIEEGKRFGIVVQKVTSPTFAQEYMDVNALTGGITIESVVKLKLNVVRLHNPPVLNFEGDRATDDKGNKIPSRDMTIKDLFDTRFPEFFPILVNLQIFIGKLENEGIETKKS